MSLLTNLISYYKFDENQGSSVSDSIGGNTGTWNGTLGSQWTTGKINSGGNFNGSDNYIDFGNPSSITGLGISDFTISAWVKTSNTGSRKSIFSFGAGGVTTNHGGYLFINSSNNLEFDLINTAGPTGSVNLTNNNFHHVLIVNSANSIQLWVDNSTDGSSQSMSPNITSGNVRIGSSLSNDGTPFYFNGLIDEVAIWNRVLLSSEISQLYNGGAGLSYPFTIFVSDPLAKPKFYSNKDIKPRNYSTTDIKSKNSKIYQPISIYVDTKTVAVGQPMGLLLALTWPVGTSYQATRQ